MSYYPDSVLQRRHGIRPRLWVAAARRAPMLDVGRARAQTALMLASGATDTASVLTALSHFTWPVVVVLLALIFKDAAAAALHRLTSLKTAGAEAIFAARVDDVVRDSGDLSSEAFNSVSSERQAFLLSLARKEPAEAIKQAWRLVQEAAQSLARKRHLAWNTTPDLVASLDEEGLLDTPTVQLILDLRALRYDMAGRTEHDIQPATATAYITAATTAAGRLAALPDGQSLVARGMPSGAE